MDVSYLSDWLMWETLKAFGNSSFFASLFTAFIGAFAGAWGGAYAVQRIADRTKRRDELLQELRTCCFAIETARGIGEVYAGLKREHVRDLKVRYDEQRATVHALNEAHRAGALPPGRQVDVGVDLKRLDVVHSRAAYLETLILEKMSAPTQVRSASVSLTRATEQLNECIVQRNDLVKRLEPLVGQDEGLARIFGLPLPGGIDDMYRDIVHGIYHYTDDCIHFSRVVCEDLVAHGFKVRKAYQACLRRGARRHVMEVPEVIWPKGHDLLPPKDKYASWHAGFISRIPRSHGRRLKKCRYWVKRLWRKAGSRLHRRPAPKARPRRR